MYYIKNVYIYNIYNYLCIYLYILFILVQYIQKNKHMDSPVVWMSIPHIQNMILKKTIYFLGCFDCSML